MIESNTTKQGTKYEVIERLGSGTFGSVYKVRDLQTGQFYALKKIRVAERDIDDKGIPKPSREVIINQYLLTYSDSDTKEYFPNIHDQFYTYEDEHASSLFNNLIIEFHGVCLNRVLHGLKGQWNDIKLICFQLFEVLHYLHKMNIVHRDLKPGNILIDPLTRKIKFCDFGSSKYIESNTVCIHDSISTFLWQTSQTISTPLVTSRFYRAPELLLGSSLYTNAVDLWSLGVVVTEILLGHPFFISIQNDAEQLVSILNVLGKPTDDELFHMNIPYNNKRCIQSLPELPRLPLEPFFKPFMDPHHLELISILEDIFQYNPLQRPSAEEILHSPYFSS